MTKRFAHGVKLRLGPIFAAVATMRIALLLCACITMRSVLSAQSAASSGGARIEILNADRWDHDPGQAGGAQRLIGNVRFKHADAIMHCDSAYLHDDQTMEAFGRVGIDQGDSLHITGNRLVYSGRDRVATITEDVRLNDPGMELTTDALTYSVRERTARYSTGATIISLRDRNTLTSRNGAYLAGARKFIFSDKVHLQHPERTIDADTLHYTTTNGVADFFGPTRITQGSTIMWCDRGSYDTRNERGRFTRNGRIIDGAQELRGDSLHYDRRKGEGLAWGHVVVIDTMNRMEVRGDVGRHLQREDRSRITGHAELIMRMGKDTLFLHGDTLFASRDSAGGRVILARRGVRFFKSDMQGACDTMTYNDRDSLITLLGRPFLWSGRDQINGRTMTITLRDGKAHLLHVLRDALLSNKVDSTRFDQVAGTNITGFFAHDELVRILAEGNCRTVYFAREKQPDGSERSMGMNRADCSRIAVALDSGQVRTVTFLTKPAATMYPVEKAPIEEMRMKGFVWNEAERPRDRQDIFTLHPGR